MALMSINGASLVAQTVKRLLAMRETRVWSLGREDPLEKEMATDSSTLAKKIPWMEEPGGLQSMGSQRVRHNWVTKRKRNGINCPYILKFRSILFNFCKNEKLKQNAVSTHLMVSRICCCLVAQSCLTLCDFMDCSTPDFPVLHHLLELAQNLVHWVNDAIESFHPLSPPSPPAFNLPASESFPMSQFFTSGGQSTGASASALVLKMNIQDWFL